MNYVKPIVEEVNVKVNDVCMISTPGAIYPL